MTESIVCAHKKKRRIKANANCYCCQTYTNCLVILFRFSIVQARENKRLKEFVSSDLSKHGFLRFDDNTDTVSGFSFFFSTSMRSCSAIINYNIQHQQQQQKQPKEQRHSVDP